MRKILRLLIALSILMIPLIATAQTAPPPQTPPSVAGQWIMSLKLTKGNENDRSRIGSGGTMKCVQNGENVICRGEGSNILDGTLNGTNLVLNGEWLVGMGSNTVFDCFYNSCTAHTSSRSYKVKMHFDGSLINDGLIEGKWTAVLLIYAGRWDVEGTWRAIREQ